MIWKYWSSAFSKNKKEKTNTTEIKTAWLEAINEG